MLEHLWNDLPAINLTHIAKREGFCGGHHWMQHKSLEAGQPLQSLPVQCLYWPKLSVLVYKLDECWFGFKNDLLHGTAVQVATIWGRKVSHIQLHEQVFHDPSRLFALLGIAFKTWRWQSANSANGSNGSWSGCFNQRVPKTLLFMFECVKLCQCVLCGTSENKSESLLSSRSLMISHEVEAQKSR